MGLRFVRQAFAKKVGAVKSKGKKRELLPQAMRKFAIMICSTFLTLPKTQGLNLIAMESAEELNRPFYSNLIDTSSSTGYYRFAEWDSSCRRKRL